MKETTKRLLKDNHSQLEDMAMKVAAQYFGEKLLAWMGEKERPVRVAPTETIHLEARKMYEDFNFEMEDGGWYHLEFESDQITLDDLKRFREYEASTSRVYGVPVTTCVICSAKNRQILSSFKEGINTYQVKIIRMKDSNADEVFEKIKQEEGVNSDDLIPVLLSPLMGGEMPVKERILQGIKVVRREEKNLSTEEVNKMQAVLYAFASKFLNDNELKEVEGMIAMTKLGQMLMERGYERGIEQGKIEGIKVLVETCKELELSKEEILSKIKTKFNLTEKDAEEYILKFW